MTSVDAKRVAPRRMNRQKFRKNGRRVRVVPIALVTLFIVLDGCTAPFTLAGFLDGEDSEPSGTVIEEQDFETVAPGIPANSIGFNSFSDGGTSAQVLFWSGRNVLALTDTSPSGQVYAHQMIVPFITSRATIEYTIAQSAGQMLCHLELWDQTHVPVADLHIDDSGNLYHTDSLGADHFVANMVVERLYHFRFEVNLSTQRYDLYLDGSRVLSDVVFRNPASTLVFVEFRTSTPDFGSMLVLDHLKVVAYD